MLPHASQAILIFQTVTLLVLGRTFFGKMNSEQGEVPCLKGSELPFASRVLPEGCLQGQATGLCA